MKLGLNIVGVLLVFAGLTFFLQGTSILKIGNSYMTGEAQWALIGIVLLIIGGGLLFRNNQKRLQS